jgi:hypothetical protein
LRLWKGIGYCLKDDVHILLADVTFVLHNERYLRCRLSSRGRCYDHNFLRFFPFSGEKNGVFLKYQCYDHFFKISFVLSQKHQFFCKIFRRKYLKNHNIGPRKKVTVLINFSLAVQN